MILPEKSKLKATMFTPFLVIVVFLLVCAVQLLPDEVLGLTDNPYLAVVVIQLITYAVPSLFYYKLRGRNFSQKMRLRLFRPGTILFLVYAALLLISGVFLLSILMYTVSPDAFVSDTAAGYASFAMNKRFFDGAYIVIAFAVLPAVTEEFLFRGIVIAEYERFGALIAVIMSSSMFAMSHFSFARFPIYFFCGIVLSCVTFATRSVIAPMVIHTLNNAAVLLFEKYIIGIVDKHNVSVTLLLIILVGITILSAMAMCFEAGSIYREMSDRNIQSEYAYGADRKNGFFIRFSESFITPAFLLLVIIFIAATLTEL